MQYGKGALQSREQPPLGRQHASVPSGPERISVAYGNIPAPGLGKSVCKRKVAADGGANGNLKVICGIGCQKHDFGAEMAAGGTKMDTKGTKATKLEPNG